MQWPRTANYAIMESSILDLCSKQHLQLRVCVPGLISHHADAQQTLRSSALIQCKFEGFSSSAIPY